MPEENGTVNLNAGDAGNSNDAGNANGNSNNSDGNAGGGTADLFASLSDDNKQFAQAKGLTAEAFDVNKMFDMHRNADRMISQGAHKQTDNNGNPGDGQNIPATPSGYEFSMPQNMPEGLPYDKGFADKFADFALNNKVPKELAGKLHDFYAGSVAEQFTSNTQTSSEQLAGKINESFSTLTKEWGEPETPGFQRNLELSKRAMKNLDPGFKQGLIDAGVIRVDGKDEVVTNASILMGLQKVGSTMYAEDAEFGGTPSTENPFDPKTENLGAQGEIIRSNPEMAKQLIRAAGVQEDWAHVLNK